MAIDQKIETCLEEFASKQLDKYKSVNGSDIVGKRNALLYAADGVNDVTQLAERVLQDFVTASDETSYGQILLPELVNSVMTTRWMRHGRSSIFENAQDQYVEILIPKLGPDALNKSGVSDVRKRFNDYSEEHGIETGVHIVGYSYGEIREDRNRGFAEVAGREFWQLVADRDDVLDKSLNIAVRIRRKFARSMTEEKNRLKEEILAKLLQGTVSGNVDWHRMLQAFTSN